MGAVRYLNARPLVYGWPDIVLDHPAALCERLAAGELDVALVSSFEFLRHPIYTIVDGVSIASAGPVYSVYVAHRGDFAELDTIELDPRSATSTHLVHCLLREMDKQVDYRKATSPNECCNSDASGKLLIGDQAIQFRHENGDRFRYWDLGEQWQGRFGMPFVYALWLIRPNVENPRAIAERLRALRDENLQHLDELIAGERNHSAQFCSFYFHDCLKFGFGDPEKEGLLRFRSLCEKHGILPANATPLTLA